MPLIHDTDALAALCTELAGEPYITLDTEFIREKTYRPQLCLVQVAGANRAQVIDPLARGIDLAPLWALLANRNVLKVLHAARQDVEIFLHLMGELPGPLYDTQIAATVCGFGEQTGYETLVSSLLKQSLDKGSQFTDWARRPLTDRQLAYALGDVTHLRGVYEKLAAQIATNGREEWIVEEMAKLADTGQYRADPQDAWKKLRYRVKTPKYLGLLKALGRWREETAATRNLPRGWILKDEALLEIASHPPRSIEELRSLRAVPKEFKADWSNQLLKLVEEAQPLPPEEMPPKEPRMQGPSLGPAVDLLRVLLKSRCEEARVTPRMVAGESDLEALLRGQDTPILHGWRYELFGREAQALAGGKMTLGLGAKGRVEVREISSAE